MPSTADPGTQLESYVAKLVKSDRDNSRSEVLRKGVRLVEEREKRLAALDLAIARGLADADAGPGEAGARGRDPAHVEVPEPGEKRRMIVIFTEEAEADLEQIGDHIAQDNSTRVVVLAP